MNDAHIHLLFNHFPIIGTIIGLITLIYGLAMKSSPIRKTGLVILFLSSLFAIPTFLSGEGAEDIVEKQGIGNDIIHDHEEIAETFIWIIALMGVVAAVSLVMELKKQSAARLAGWVTTVIGLVAVFFAVQVGTTGGAVNHPEIRKEVQQGQNTPDQSGEEQEEDQDH